MATRKDLLKAQAFTTRRMVAAFVDRDPDDPTPPLKRVGTATFVSILLGVILLAGTALISLINPGGGAGWNQEGVVITDTQAGVQFVYVEDGQVLIPMANVTSARLFAAGEQPEGPPQVVKVDSKALKGVKQAPVRGIPDAPRQLPDKENMRVYPLRVCSAPSPRKDERFTTVEFGAPSPAPNTMSFIAQSSDNTEWLIVNGRAHKLWSPQGQPSPLTLPRMKPGRAWLEALPLGTPFDPIPIENLKATPGGHNPHSLQIGQLVKAEGIDKRLSYYVQLDGGLTRIGAVDAQILMAAHNLGEPRTMSESDVAKGRNEAVPDLATDQIYDAPQAEAHKFDDVSVCATYTEQSPDRVILSVEQQGPDVKASRPRNNVADLVVMEPLAGALLKNADNDREDSVSFLVLADGKQYPIPDIGSRKALGYGDITPTPVPPGLLALFENGLQGGHALSRSFVTELRKN